jgi:hypothetical protein
VQADHTRIDTSSTLEMDVFYPVEAHYVRSKDAINYPIDFTVDVNTQSAETLAATAVFTVHNTAKVSGITPLPHLLTSPGT